MRNRSDLYLLLVLCLLQYCKVQTLGLDSLASYQQKYIKSVVNWLTKCKDECFQVGQEQLEWRWNNASRFAESPYPILQLSASTSNSNQEVWLHLIPSPRQLDDCLPPTCTRDMTQRAPVPIIHLHQDVWRTKHEIVKSRLKMRLGKTSRRVFARKTAARRIQAAMAIPFLQEHHLWGATKAKYFYGLFLSHNNTKDENEELIAVASFSSRRKVARCGVPHRSHELIRCCSRRDVQVVGGITKLVKTFTKEQKPDDIVTVVDRDWGTGVGWHSLNFETVATMPPLVMAVDATGVRRHLVGAGIQSPGSNDVQTGRAGLEASILEELERQSSAEAVLQCLAKHGHYPVYDVGVERLLMMVPNATSLSLEKSVARLWQHSIPKYAAVYYSANKGISALLEHSKHQCGQATQIAPKRDRQPSLPLERFPQQNNNTLWEMEQQPIREWRETAGTAKTANLVFQAPSSLDTTATVEVRERPGGWCTLGIRGGRTKSIYHGIFRRNGPNKRVDPSVLISEHLRTMASVALAALEGRQDTLTLNIQRDLSFLYLGFGAGTLLRFMSYAIPGSKHVAVELDQGVVQAAQHCQLLQDGAELHLQDALLYERAPHQPPFDVVFVDIFDGDNLLPQKFYCVGYLRHLLENILRQDQAGVVIHNFHTGSMRLNAQLQEAKLVYHGAFPTVITIDSMDSKANAGNTILFAFTESLKAKPIASLQQWGTTAQKRWGNVNFDIVRRATLNLADNTTI